MYSILLLALMTSLTNARDPCPKIGKPQGPFDINKFSGIWYDIVRASEPGYANHFEENLDCIYANYTRFNRNEFKFYNEGKYLSTGDRDSSTYIARQTDQPNRLKLQFSHGEKNYYIVDTDFETYAIVWSCRVILGFPKNFIMKYGWILGRKKNLPEEIIKKGIKKLVDLGMPEGRVIRIEHSETRCKK